MQGVDRMAGALAAEPHAANIICGAANDGAVPPPHGAAVTGVSDARTFDAAVTAGGAYVDIGHDDEQENVCPGQSNFMGLSGKQQGQKLVIQSGSDWSLPDALFPKTHWGSCQKPFWLFQVSLISSLMS